MASSLTHAVVGYGIGKLLIKEDSSEKIPLLTAGVAAMPDLDVLTYAFGAGTDPIFGHRGWTHSLLFVLVAAPLLALLFRRCAEFARISFSTSSLLMTVSLLSHILLDMTTDGTRGVALLAPFDATAYFLPVRLLVEAPIVFDFFSSGRTVTALCSEIVLIWLPMFFVFAAVRQRDAVVGLLRGVWLRGSQSA